MIALIDQYRKELLKVNGFAHSTGCCSNRNFKSGHKFSARFCDSEHLNSKR